MSCQHLNFAANVHVGRITDGEGGPVIHYTADLSIRCAECGLQFRFKGIPRGFDYQGPHVDFLGVTACLPLEPADARVN